MSLSLAVNLEILALQGTAAINGTGNSAANTLIGNSANNILNGGAGADTMNGGGGNDTYVVDRAADRITEAAAAGTDRINSFVSFSLSANLEILALQGNAAINGIGNASANTLIGNSAANVLDGGAGGRDLLTGQAGADLFRFSSRPSSFLTANADRLSDFNAGQGDRIRISRAAFGITASTASLTAVTTTAAQTTALATDALFVYNSSNGELLWNQNGAAAGAGTGGVLAVLSNQAPLTGGALQLV
ncbi:MAG: hypothetical protein ACKOXO_04665 [Cyanobium sp.]